MMQKYLWKEYLMEIYLLQIYFASKYCAKDRGSAVCLAGFVHQAHYAIRLYKGRLNT